MDPLNPGGISPEEHRHWREMLGAFVLGKLDEGERVALQAHLDGCAECRAEVEELRPVAGALAEASPERLVDAEAPPPGLIDGILAQVGRERQLRKRRQRRRRVGRSILAAAAAALFVAIGFFALPPLISPAPPLEQVAFSETAAGVEADANLVAHTWGTETKLVASGLRDGQTYKVALVSGDGALVPSGAFIGTGESPVECNLNAPLLREDVAGLEVRSANGELMLYAELPEDAPSAGRESPLAGLLPNASWAPWGSAAQASVPEMAVVPAVGGLAQGDAEEKLEEAGFGAEVTYKEGPPEKAGNVLSQSPEGGEKLRKGVRVVLTVGETGNEVSPDEETPNGESPDEESRDGEAVPPSVGEGAPAEDADPVEPSTPVKPPAPLPAPAPPSQYQYGQDPAYYKQPADEQRPDQTPVYGGQYDDGGQEPYYEEPSSEEPSYDDGPYQREVTGYEDGGY